MSAFVLFYPNNIKSSCVCQLFKFNFRAHITVKNVYFNYKINFIRNIKA